VRRLVSHRILGGCTNIASYGGDMRGDCPRVRYERRGMVATSSRIPDAVRSCYLLEDSPPLPLVLQPRESRRDVTNNCLI
jgi:hypothetical protein